VIFRIASMENRIGVGAWGRIGVSELSLSRPRIPHCIEYKKGLEGVRQRSVLFSYLTN
jgi:hypothetical protein